ncbi:hypothetical protein SERLA73DRAFT_74141 [Serpula lacrymans var. lacrymans S7.3]|uniref:Terpenoid synthase n=2 Tax=Serpula lacrymans var. lacrymans TaxID=341189 RepID=F8Q0Q9_SERL3|nr:uncharacterized protein SERLADRAFT_438780 [Serpula lacrymans var. lacrymans S7.9]EGN97888.1 hypothetical protein SERLA73DRAFT_74141 [Serpula lacrymans var. lacrymans S7.3]EGO23470.1 hypothetical protein SERLADRAFT_438780 [Serpula lacrymans var. lacrymans S7.9]
MPVKHTNTTSLHSSCTQDSTSYIPRLQLLLREIGYRYEAPLPTNPGFHESFHEWFKTTLGPALSWDSNKLHNLEKASSSLAERAYPFADTEMNLLMGKLIAIALSFDDSIKDDEMYTSMAGFTQRVYLGMAQPPGVLAIYHGVLKELSIVYEEDTLLMGLAVVPWITYVDGCLMEKRLLTVDAVVRASPLDMGYQHLLEQQHHFQRSLPSPKGARIGPKCDGDKQGMLPIPLKGDAVNFPRYLRLKTGISESFVAAIFKANRGQKLPLTRYLHALPDLVFQIEMMNDLLSFHKEEIDGEQYNVIHLRTQALRSASKKGSQGREWTLMDTFNLLCDEVRDATFRIDAMLRLDEVERKLEKGERRGHGEEDVDIFDETIAKQWRLFKDGYISWHLESSRYKLDFLKKAEYA